MRRGHSGIGGWRSENPRHFRSRIGGNPHYRPPRGYGVPETTRFPPPGPRSIRPQYNSRLEKDYPTEQTDRPRYRGNRHDHYQRSHQHGDRKILPLIQHARQDSDNLRNKYDETSNFYEDVRVPHFHMNSMGDIDHRQIPQPREGFGPRYVSPWISDNLRRNNDHIHNKQYRQDINEGNKVSFDYAGHRPPSSDHSVIAIDNSHSFTRSVDDTVDIVRKRLLNRNDPSQPVENNTDTQTNIQDQQPIETVVSFQTNQQEQPMKKRIQRQRQNVKTNCAKIKNKIVHQLFKMDKEKIHKLMDNPSSSTKFEYAISSLITESQNSFNRHLRSAAEKSLCSSSEFMQNDNNTIYEDTFMKQMQCILDPQDTVFLEDIKPFVMAELNKALQLNEFEPRYDISEDDNNYNQQDDLAGYHQYPSDTFTYDNNFPQENLYGQSNPSQMGYTGSESADVGNFENNEHNQLPYEDFKPLFERRQRTKSCNFNQKNDNDMCSAYYRRASVDNNPSQELRSETPPPLFDSSAEHFSEEEDPFAELDKQYHVAVDHDFIENDDIYTTQDIKKEQNTLETLKLHEKNTENDSNNISSTSVKSSINNDNSSNTEHSKYNSHDNISLQIKTESNINDNSNEHNEPELRNMTKENEKTNDSTYTAKSSTPVSSRKRSVEQRPSHRKEKRKKSDTCPPETSKQILNKNIIINVNDCASKASEKCDAPKSVFNLFFSKDDGKAISKDNKKVNLSDKSYTEKHVKRKETPKKSSDKDSKIIKKENIITASQPTSPIENTSYNQDQMKSDGKIMLKPIDMFTEQPKKSNIHHAHRNTALMPTSIPKSTSENTLKLKGPISRQITKRHVAVQVIRKLPSKETQVPDPKCFSSKFCQTDRKKFFSKAIQTDLPHSDKKGTRSNDAFERMKEIDLEIQVLLQEKFKLYSSIETKDSNPNSMQTLGMTVLNVSQFDGDQEENVSTEDNLLSEDAIVDDFANIPVEELEQIAFESVQTHQNESPKIGKHNQGAANKKRSKKVKSPNISLIEQIITDDRPLEDIISLDDFEITPVKTKPKNSKARQRPKKKAVSKANRARAITPIHNFKIRECSVVLTRIDITMYLKETVSYQCVDKTEIEEPCKEVIKVETNHKEYEHVEDVIEETVVNDIQLDMLDVSEDIVVGDICEVKSLEDKEDIIENMTVPISEEIILDNSQSSMEDMATPAVSQEDICKVYDYSADENLRRDSVIVTGNGDAVLAIECVENNFLAACLDGNVYYFNNEGQMITTLRGSNLAVTCLTIVKEKYGTTVYTGSLDSRIRYYDLETGLEKGPECNVLSPIQTMDRAWDTVFVGTRTGFVLQFECKNNMLIPVSSVKFSEQSILALRAMKEGPRKVLLVAARSENVTIKDAQTGLLLRTLVGPKMTVYTLLYEDGKVYCGTSSHQIHVFDYTSGSHVGTHEGGKGAVCLRATGGLVFAGCYDGCVYVYREGETKPLVQLRGPSLMLLSLAIVGTKIIAGYKDRSLYIWKIPLCILQEMIL